MSQELVPVSNADGLVGLAPTIVTTTAESKVTALSEEYRAVNNLEKSPTQWVPGGRPIYKRLPASSESYQVDFFADGDIGYTYIPPGQDQFGAGSMYVAVSENRSSLLIYDGVIVWEKGTTPVLKAIVDLNEISLVSGRFLVAYQLFYDDAPLPLPFQATDYSLGGQDFEVFDSASDIFLSAEKPNGNGWPYPGINAFAPSDSGLSWKNYLETVNRVPQKPTGVLPGIPDPYQPRLCWLSWASPLPWKLDTITLRTPLIGSLPEATLYYWEQEEWKAIQTVSPSQDVNGFYYQFQTDNAVQTKWRVEWPFDTKMEIEDITVSGLLYLYSRPSTERARAQLAIYPANLIPENETLCRLAYINVDNYEVQENARGELLVQDVRNISNRDYEPVANWLTQYWDDNLTSMLTKVGTYTPGFMAPPTLLKTSYYDLDLFGIDVNDDPPPYPPTPPPERVTNLVRATVLVEPPYDEGLTATVLIGAPSPGSPQITNIDGVVIP